MPAHSSAGKEKKGPLPIRAYQTKMRQMGKGKGRTINQGNGIRNCVGLTDVDVPVLDGVTVQTNRNRGTQMISSRNRPNRALNWKRFCQKGLS